MIVRNAISPSPAFVAIDAVTPSHRKAPSIRHAIAALPSPSRHVVTSPLVGTCRNGSTGMHATSIECGDAVHAGQILCVIEAMRLEHAIRAPHSGRVVEALVADGDPVDFGRPLFVVDDLEGSGAD